VFIPLNGREEKNSDINLSKKHTLDQIRANLVRMNAQVQCSICLTTAGMKHTDGSGTGRYFLSASVRDKHLLAAFEKDLTP
jgi:hypothetical protein